MTEEQFYYLKNISIPDICGVISSRVSDMEYDLKCLKKENAKLKADYKVLSCSVDDFGKLQDRLEEEQRKNNGLEEQLNEAKEIIKGLLENCFGYNSKTVNYVIKAQAEKFLKEE